jgi:hypothetical protein
VLNGPRRRHGTAGHGTWETFEVRAGRHGIRQDSRRPRLSGVAFRSGTFLLLKELGRMNAVQAILLTVSVAVFIYLGIAMFKPEWF